MKFAVVTFGCRVNQADSRALEAALRGRGASPGRADDADLVVVNTCSVTASADQAARQAIRRVHRLNPRARVAVTGCYATRRPVELARLPGVLRVVPNARKEQAGALATELTTAATAGDGFGHGGGACGSRIEPGAAGRTTWTLSAQTGCAEACAYCVVPATRGRPTSRPVDLVLGELEVAAAAGFKEVTLAGVHLGSWGRDLVPVLSLVDLLRAVARLDLPLRVRISSLEPMDCSHELIDLVAGDPRFAPHFHLPLQHASDRVLRAMRRPYTLAAYDRLVTGVRERLPHAAIGTDVIAGFPGETDDDFAWSAAYLARSPLTSLHVFPYSDRPGTVASAMTPKVPGRVVRTRAEALRAVGLELARRFRLSQAGQVRRALTLEDGAVALTDNYLKVRIPPGRARNEWVELRLENEAGALTGTVVV